MPHTHDDRAVTITQSPEHTDTPEDCSIKSTTLTAL